MQEIDKYLVFIVSGGRTGTTFLGELLDEMIQDAFSVHEPDVFTGFNKKTWQRLQTFGFYHMVLGRALGRTGIRNLSQQYQAGELSNSDLVKAIQRHREKFYSSIVKDMIIESFSQWYGVLPAIQSLLEQYRAVGIVRDPRDWTTSCINRGRPFGRKDMVWRLNFRRLDPKMVGDYIYAERWQNMSQFQKVCWTWSRIYERIINFANHDENSRLFFYEDLFLSQDRERHFQSLLEFITDFHEQKFDYEFRSELLDRKINAAGRKEFPDWHNWDVEHAKQLHEICGEQMQKLGYGNEPEWLEKIT